MAARSRHGTPGPRAADDAGTTSTASTKTAVTSLSAFGLSPALIAAATTSRKITAPTTAPAIQRPTVRLPDSTSPDHERRHARDCRSDAHLDVGEALELGEERARERDQSVGQAESEHEPSRPRRCRMPRHLRVVSRGAHGQPEIGAQERREADGQRDGQQAVMTTRLARLPPLTVVPPMREAGRQAEQALTEPFGLGEDAVRRGERKVAAAHDEQADRVERGAGQDTGEQRHSPGSGSAGPR